MNPPASAVAPPPVQSAEFDGPLDLLLDEVRRQNVSIENVSMGPIVTRFLEYMQNTQQRDLNLDIEWLHMASTLIYWKSQALLPADAEPEPRRDPIRDELVRLLLNHKKQLALEFERLRTVAQSSFSRPPDGSAVPEEPEEPASTTVWDMIQQARDIERWIRQQAQNRRLAQALFFTSRDEVTVSEMIGYLHKRLAADGALDGLRLMEEETSNDRRSCLFLAMLEMACSHEIEIHQTAPFDEIMISRVS
jgi:segregation and condensation protein A